MGLLYILTEPGLAHGLAFTGLFLWAGLALLALGWVVVARRWPSERLVACVLIATGISWLPVLANYLRLWPVSLVAGWTQVLAGPYGVTPFGFLGGILLAALNILGWSVVLVGAADLLRRIRVAA
jgi:hypothetical protein